jgi:hypothetical protein
MACLRSINSSDRRELPDTPVLLLPAAAATAATCRSLAQLYCTKIQSTP